LLINTATTFFLLAKFKIKKWIDFGEFQLPENEKKK
jgi:hypothetical protein